MEKNLCAALWVGVVVVGMGSGVAIVYAAVSFSPTPFVGLDFYSGPPGSTIQVSGGNYMNGEIVSLYLGSTLTPPVASSRAREDSLFGPVAVVIPPATVQGPLLITAIGASSTLSASNSFYVQGLNPTLSVASTTVNTPGAMLTLSGAGFVANEPINISLGSASSTMTADGIGNFSNALLTIPVINSGTYLIQATGQFSHTNASAYFFVGGFFPVVTPSEFYAIPGDTLTFNGKNFAPNEVVGLSIGTSTATTTIQFSAEGSGSFTNMASYQIPFEASNSSIPFIFRGSSSGATATASVTVGQLNAVVTLSKYFILPGEQLTFSGHGFGGGEMVDIVNGTSTIPLVSFPADSTGAFFNAGNLMVPFAMASSTPMFIAKGRTSGAIASATVTVGSFSASITPSAFFLQRGNSFMVRGTGFAPNESVTVTVGGNVPRSSYVDAAGNVGVGPFIVSLTSPSTLIVRAAGTSSGASASTSISVGDAVTQQVVTSSLMIFLNINNRGIGTATSSDFTVSITGANATPGSFTATNGTTTVMVNGDTAFTVVVNSAFDNYVSSASGMCTGQILAGTSADCTLTELYTSPIFISPDSLPDGTVGSSYSAMLTAAPAASGTLTWTISQGTLPTGLSLSTTNDVATISGVPTTIGTSTFSVKADVGISKKFKAYTIAVTVPQVATQTNTQTSSGGGGGGGTPAVFVSVPAPVTLVPYGSYVGGGIANLNAATIASSTLAIPGLPNTGGNPSIFMEATTTSANLLDNNVGASLEIAALKQKVIVLSAAAHSCPAIFSRNLRKGMKGNDVKNLQRLLNFSQFTQVATTGSGSMGNETDYFGSATMKAVVSFQNIFAQDVLSPYGLSAGTGIVGPATRAKLNSLCENNTFPTSL